MKPNGQRPARAPAWAIWLGLFGALVVLVVAAFLLNRQFGAKIGTQRGSVAVASSPSVPPAPSAHSLGSAMPATSPASPSGSPATSVAPSASADTSPLAQQVAAAYLRYWRVYSDALLNLDTSRVPRVATGDELRRIQQEVDGVRKQHEAVRVDVEHHYFVFNVTQTTANVYDEVHNHSFTVDPITKQPAVAPSDHTDIEKDTYFLKKQAGVWKVTKSTRQRDSGA